MTFLNPFLLFGLIAAAIPVILHLLNLRKLRTVEFSSLAFLKELQQTRIRRLKFRQILLLILRTLAILCLVLAFARPALRGSFFGGLGGTARSTIVFIFDDSFSMSTGDQFGNLLKQAQEKTEKLLDLVNPGDELYLIRLSDLPAATIDPATHDIEAVRQLIRETPVSMVSRPMTEALSLADKLLARSKNANKEVYVISDMQRTLFPSERRSDSSAAPDENRNYFLVEIGAKPAANIAVDSIEVVSKILEKDKPVQLSAIVRNYSPTPVANSVLSAFLENARAGQSTLRIDPWGTATVSLTVTPKKAGIIHGYVELENDAVEYDNRRYFSFTIPERLNVAVVTDNGLDARFPLLALQAGETDTVKSIINVQQVTSPRFPLVDLRSTDVLVLMDVKGISAGSITGIKSFVQRGGGVILLPSGNTQPAEWRTLLSTLALPSPSGMLGSRQNPASLSFQKVDLDHPLFGAIFENRAGRRPAENERIESPQILMAMQYNTGRSGHEIITMTGGNPFLAEFTSGEGRILLFSVAPVLAWSDFPLKGIFVPLIHRSVVYLGSRERSSVQAVTGEDAMIMVPPSAAGGGEGSQYTLTSPDGTQEYVQPVSSMAQRREGAPAGAEVPSGMIGFVKPRVPLPGFYELKRGPAVLSVLSANVDARESDTRRIDQDDLETLWEQRGITPQVIPSIDQAAQLQAAVIQSRFGIELWKYFLLAALLLAIVEMFVARDATRKEE